jgi:hypothetical protein
LAELMSVVLLEHALYADRLITRDTEVLYVLVYMLKAGNEVTCSGVAQGS